jgi:hypothetical protein
VRGVKALPAALCLVLLCGTAGSVRADALQDAKACLDERARAESERDLRLHEADSLGRRIESLRGEGKEIPEDWLRSAEKIQRQAMEQELELMSRRLRCRDLVEKALAACSKEIVEVEGEIRAGRGGPDKATRLLVLQDARTSLEAELTGPVTLGYPLLPADSTDTQEVLRGKLQYYRDVRGDLAALEGKVNARLERVTEERRTLAEAQRFIRDLSFLGEGGRALPGGISAGPGGIAVGGDSTWSRGEVTGGSSSRDLELVLGLTPATPEQSDRLIRLLQGFLKEIRKEMAIIDQEMGKLEQRILPENGRP